MVSALWAARTARSTSSALPRGISAHGSPDVRVVALEELAAGRLHEAAVDVHLVFGQSRGGSAHVSCNGIKATKAPSGRTRRSRSNLRVYWILGLSAPWTISPQLEDVGNHKGASRFHEDRGGRVDDAGAVCLQQYQRGGLGTLRGADRATLHAARRTIDLAPASAAARGARVSRSRAADRRDQYRGCADEATSWFPRPWPGRRSIAIRSVRRARRRHTSTAIRD